MADPKKGTGKKPKGSGRRLYTDENPRDTVSIKFPFTRILFTSSKGKAFFSINSDLFFPANGESRFMVAVPTTTVLGLC